MIEERSQNVSKTAKHVVLTDRDLKLLLDLYENVVSSFYQIHEKFFAGRSHATVMNRLRLLEENEYITRTKVPRIKSWRGDREIGVVFQVSLKSIRILQRMHPSVVFNERPSILNVPSLDHDLILNDIKDKLVSRYPSCQWINGKNLSPKDLRKIPDAVLLIKNQPKVVAIELELHGKSNQRYSQIITEFRMSPGIEKVIYITPNVQIDRKIMSVIEGFEVPAGHKLSTGFFEFMSLDEIMSR
nr:hypothetical protein HAGR004_19510 [Bdellovibrio sp. HAGR004]